MFLLDQLSHMSKLARSTQYSAGKRGIFATTKKHVIVVLFGPFYGKNYCRLSVEGGGGGGGGGGCGFP